MKLKKLVAIVLCAFFCAGSIGVLSACSNKDENAIYVGSKDFTESLLVGEIYALALEDAGYKVERELNIAGTLVHSAITNDEIDLYPEYTGTALYSILNMKDVGNDVQTVYDTVKREYAERYDITWLKQSDLNDTNGFAIRTETAERLGIYTISDLQAKASEIRVASQGEFELREDGLPGLEKVYGKFNFKSIKVYDNGIKYEILKNNQADVTPAYSTEGQLVNTHLFTYLIDDKNFWPPYYLAPIVRNETLEKFPGIEEVLNKISDALDTETIISLNAKVDIEKQEYEDVAREFYDSIA